MERTSNSKQTRRRLKKMVPVLVAAALINLFGCSTLPDDPVLGPDITERMLLEGAPFFAGDQAPASPQVDVLAMTPDMKRFVDFYVERDAPAVVKLRQLQSAIIHSGNLNLDYSSQTLTAAQTFVRGNGNCLSFTNLFIAMARSLGLKAEYQEVDVPPSWNRRGDTMILNRHINIYVRTSASGRDGLSTAEVVDFNAVNVKSNYEVKRISDRRAKAHYFSNIGVDYLQAGRYAEAFVFLRAGLEQDASFDALWINLGALYARINRLDYAEKAYLNALSRHDSMTGLSSLARIYERQGELERAALYRERVEQYLARNPYYQYHLAEAALVNGDYSEAVDNLKTAIALKPSEDAFYFLLGVVHLKRGDWEQARSWFGEAQAVAQDPVTRHRYNARMRRLFENPEIEYVDS